MNFLEFQAAVERLRSLLLNAQLQDFAVEEKDLVLLFYAGKSFALHISLRTPPVIFFEYDAFKLSQDTRKSPIGLFLGRHFLRKSVSEIRHKDDWGRRVELHFNVDHQETFYIEITLVPGFQNIGVFAENKRIFWQKPRKLPDSISELKTDVLEFRSLDQIREEWYGQGKTGDKLSTEKDWKKEVQKKILKKSEAIEKIINLDLENKNSVQAYYKVGELLKYQSIAELSVEDKKWINDQQTREWNREHLFKKAKAMASKKSGMAARIEVLSREIAELTDSLDGPPPEPKHNISVAGKVSVETRKLEVSGTLSLYMGKNAKDNVQLLKSSQPWEIWFHLKDYPSAYAITRRNKGVLIEHGDMIKMAVWFAKECFKSKKEKLPTHVEIIYAETRFVKLLKGDRLGRVTYANGKTLRISIT